MQDRLRKIDTAQYIQNSLVFSDKENELVRDFNEWLPKDITDCHAHCGLPEHVLEIDDQMYNEVASTFQGFSLDDSYKLEQIIYGDKNLSALRFPFPFRGIDIKNANKYLLENTNAPDKVALCGIPTDQKYTNLMLRTGRFNALKMYHQQFNPPAKAIFDYFPSKVLEVAEEMNVPIILHLPKMLTFCKDELLDVARSFPNLKISLAHLGLAHLVFPNLQETYDEIATHKNIYMDTAMVPSKDVLKMAITSFGPKRIMFGSDEPLNLIRSVIYYNPKLGQRIVTEYMYHWVNKEEHEEYKHLAKGAIHMHWPAIQAIRAAIEEIYGKDISLQNSVKNDIFNNNAKEFFKF